MPWLLKPSAMLVKNFSRPKLDGNVRVSVQVDSVGSTPRLEKDSFILRSSPNGGSRSAPVMKMNISSKVTLISPPKTETTVYQVPQWNCRVIPLPSTSSKNSSNSINVFLSFLQILSSIFFSVKTIPLSKLGQKCVLANTVLVFEFAEIHMGKFTCS